MPQEGFMARAKKAKRSAHVVMYIRVKPEDYVKITKITAKRGYPCTLANVAAELISRGLTTEEKAP